jgi:hypothetical protein
LFLATLPFRGSKEPAYQGKTVSVWFKEYAFATNALIRKRVVGYLPDGRVFVMQPASKGDTIKVEQVSTNRPNWTADLRSRFEAPPRQPAWEALQSLGSNAVPCLVRHLRIGPLDRAYERAVTNFPVFVQHRLPNPAQKRWYRVRALQTLSQLKDSARGATPALLELLHQREPLLRSLVLTTLRSIYADAHSISGVLLQLGNEQRFDEVLLIARETKWQGREVAQLFGEILQATNTAMHRDAIWLLEASGERAAPALDGILAALRSSDGEVRYLAARAEENIRRKVMPEAQSQVVAALEPSLNDEKDTVRNVARRALARLQNSADAKHEGKTVEQWFQAYVTSRETRIPANASPVMNGEFLPRTPVHNQPDPAWTAFQALGEKAIPDLLRNLSSSGEPATSEPAQLARSQAIDLIHWLGPTARSAAPALFALLKQADESEADHARCPVEKSLWEP